MKKIVVILVMLIFACNKKEEPFFETINISGYVYDQVGNKKVRLSDVTVEVNYSSSPFQIPIKWMHTDSTGTFNITFKPEKNKVNSLYLSHNNKFIEGSNVDIYIYMPRTISIETNKEFQYFEVELDSIR